MISIHWEKSLLAHMGFVKRNVTTKAKVSVNEFVEHTVQFLFDTKAFMYVSKWRIFLIV